MKSIQPEALRVMPLRSMNETSTASPARLRRGVEGREGIASSAMQGGVVAKHGSPATVPWCPRCKREYVQAAPGSDRWEHPFSESGCRYSGTAVVVPPLREVHGK